MDLDRHLKVLWKHRAIVIGGIVLGLVTAFLAAYTLTGGGFERRGSETWSSSSMVFVTQQGFPWGRVTLPSPLETAAEGENPEDRYGDAPFSDPARLTQLAQLYSVMSSSDRVRELLPGPPAAEQIEALPVDPTGRGDQFLPIVQMTTRAGSAAAAYDLNRQTVAALKRMLLQEQRSNGIPGKDRVQIQVLKSAGAPVLEAGPSWASSMLAFVLCVGAAIALAHLLEGLSLARVRSGRTNARGATALYPDADMVFDPDADVVFDPDVDVFDPDPDAVSEHRRNGAAGAEPVGARTADSRPSRVGAHRERLRNR